MDTCICMTESLRCSLDTITTLSVGYTPIQNAFSVRKIKLKKRVNKTKSGNRNRSARITGLQQCKEDVRSWCSVAFYDSLFNKQ